MARTTLFHGASMNFSVFFDVRYGRFFRFSSIWIYINATTQALIFEYVGAASVVVVVLVSLQEVCARNIAAVNSQKP